MRFKRSWHLVLILFVFAGFAVAGTAAFDLPGPRIDVRVTRKGKTLPISEVPNLQPGDRVWVHPELPPEQSVHFLLIATFLRGATNPPPDNWFIKVETWSKKAREEGIVLTVPPDAQQVLLFLAPETNGDFSNLRAAVRGKPGAFVRASQDLNQASMDRTRLETYLSAVKETSDTNPEALHDRSTLLARSLSMKLDQQCFDKPSEQRAPCLTQNTDQLVLEDGQSQSMATALTSGAGSDLIGQLSTTRVAGGGIYSPYVGAVVDVARLMEGFHNPEYQYIPALAVPKGDELNLKLNNPPSFRKPMSVLVIGLPPVEAAQLPPLRPVSQKDVSCLQAPSLVLPVEGSPLVFSTNLAHDLVLHVESKSGPSIDLPATADPARGGLVIDSRKLRAGSVGPEAIGTVHGYWGFETWDGPSFHLLSAHPTAWTIPAADHTVLIVGRADTIHLQSEDTACVAQIAVKDSRGKEGNLSWKLIKAGELEAQVPLQGESAGPVTFLVKQHGLAEPDAVRLETYSEAARLDEFAINAGEREGVLKGTRLDEVSGLDLNGVHFTPKSVVRVHEKDELGVLATELAATTFHAGDALAAHVTLKDGRLLDLSTTVAPARPKVTLISKSIDPGASASAIHLGSQDEVPQDGKLSFLLKTEMPVAFPRDEKIEVAAVDNSFSVVLNIDDGTLILQDSQTVLAQLNPLKSFGLSAFGPLQFRPVQMDGRKGDWQPIGTLVRVPALTGVNCPPSPSQPCTLSGSNLFLLDSVASDAQFTDSVSVPLGYLNPVLSVPRPSGDLLYVKLRDDPSVVSVAAVPLVSRNGNSRPAQQPQAGPSVD